MQAATHSLQVLRQGCFRPIIALPRQFSQGVYQQRACREQQQQQQQQQYHQYYHQRRVTYVTYAEPPSSGGNNSPPSSSIIQDSDLSFIFKLVALSFAGAVLIKYGSLAISLPFEPNAAVASAIVLGTPAAYALYLLLQQGTQQQR